MVHHNSDVPNLIGHTIDDGKLKFVELIGSGSNGVIFRAIDTTTCPGSTLNYAVKCLTKAEYGSRRYMFQRREVLFHRTVSFHPNVVTLHRLISDDRYIFLVLDFCAGGDLFSFVSEGCIFPRNDELVRSVFLQILDAVEACHEHGIYHRDLKPENILCNLDCSRVFLSDFGLATKSAMSSTFGAGSSYYMSPECIGFEGHYEPYSTRANDVWALGVILTSMITGRNPWHCATPDDDCYGAYLENPNFLRDMLPISHQTNAILRRIFTRHEQWRITLTDLRELVVEADTFFMSPQEIAKSNIHVRMAAAMHLERLSTQEAAAAIESSFGSYYAGVTSFLELESVEDVGKEYEGSSTTTASSDIVLSRFGIREVPRSCRTCITDSTSQPIPSVKLRSPKTEPIPQILLTAGSIPQVSADTEYIAESPSRTLVGPQIALLPFQLTGSKLYTSPPSGFFKRMVGRFRV